MKLTRRLLLTASAAALPGCLLSSTESDDDPMSQNRGIPPWQMWGSSQRIVINQSAVAGSPLPSTSQLANIRYGRPETWFFLFSAQLNDYAGVSGVVIVNFDLTIGVGRSVLQIPSFEKYTLNGNTDIGKQYWSAVVQSPPRSSTDVSDKNTASFSAETIMCTARVQLGPPATLCDITCAAQFSPSTHVRPEWYKGHFPGGEEKGS